MMKEIFLLHLSDLHFGTEDDARKWYSQLADDLKHGLHCNRLDIIIISGDIADKAERVEYNAAYLFIDSLTREFGPDLSKVIIVPGNHDINWTLSKKCYELVDREDVKDKLECGKYVDISEEVVRIQKQEEYYKRYENFSEFYLKIKGEEYSSKYPEKKIIHYMQDEGILILGLNSAWETDHIFCKRASIPTLEIDYALDKIRLYEKYQDTLKFAVWHHPLISPYEDRIKDHGFLERLAMNDFSVCFHGHLHKADKIDYNYNLSKIGRKLHIIAAGTFGAPSKEWYPGYPLQYNLIKMKGENLIVETRRRMEINGAWVPDDIWFKGKGQNPMSYYSIKLQRGSVKEKKLKYIQKKNQTIINNSKEKKQLSADIAKYIQKAEALNKSIPLAGFKTSLRIPIKIEDIYVPLRTIVDIRPTGRSCFADAEEAEKHLSDCSGGRELSIPDAFQEAKQKKRRGLVILGDPGSGKTTQLKRILLWCTQGEFDQLYLSEETLPVFLPLRELKDTNQSLDEFIQEQLTKPHLGTPIGFGQRLLDRGNLLFLLDGLDEVADTRQRKKVSRWIEDAMRIYDTCIFVVTSRFSGYTDEARLSEEFIEMHLRPLSSEQAEKYIQNWYRIVEREIYTDKEQAEVLAKEKANDLISKLKKPEFRSARLFAMTRNPLLLTIICLVHLDRGNLPRTRVALYDECTDVLLERWRGASGIKTSVTARGGRRVLQPVAFWLHQKENRTRAKAEELAPIIEPELKAAGWSNGNAKNFLMAVQNESGILTGWDQENYGFMHLGFQEYLTACEIRNRYFENTSRKSVLRDLAKKFGESWWQEVGLLLLALEDPPLFVPYMRELVKRTNFSDNPHLVEMCLDDAAVISPIPFLELLRKKIRYDTNLWSRQLLALRILARIDKTLINEFTRELKQHPDESIRKWVRNYLYQELQDVICEENSGVELVRLPAGTYIMGVPYDSDIEHLEYEVPPHEVDIRSFYIGRYPVTNEEYARFLKDNPKVCEPPFWGDSRLNKPRQPVVGVSWNDAKIYANWANLRLPTESEWEYACRAKSKHICFYNGDELRDFNKIGWSYENSTKGIFPVGLKEPNKYGLYDMLGNVWEWVEDDWHYNYEGAPEDGSAWVRSDHVFAAKVLRGGSCFDKAECCRITYRECYGSDTRVASIGFRLAKSL